MTRSNPRQRPDDAEPLPRKEDGARRRRLAMPARVALAAAGLGLASSPITVPAVQDHMRESREAGTYRAELMAELQYGITDARIEEVKYVDPDVVHEAGIPTDSGGVAFKLEVDFDPVIAAEDKPNFFPRVEVTGAVVREDGTVIDVPAMHSRQTEDGSIVVGPDTNSYPQTGTVVREYTVTIVNRGPLIDDHTKELISEVEVGTFTATITDGQVVAAAPGEDLYVPGPYRVETRDTGAYVVTS